jgi:hypothetical protein
MASLQAVWLPTAAGAVHRTTFGVQRRSARHGDPYVRMLPRPRRPVRILSQRPGSETSIRIRSAAKRAQGR